MTNNSSNASVGDAAQNLSAGAARFAAESSAWLTTHWLEIVIAAAAGALIAFALLGLRAFGHRLVGKDAQHAHWRMILGRALARTSLFFIIMCSARLVAGYAETPPVVFQTIQFLFIIAAAFQAAIWARELILGFVQHRVGADETSSSLGSALGLIRVLVTFALFAIAIIVVLDNLGVNVTGLVAGLGIGGIAIGLAAQGIFKDLFAALAIIFDKPFRRGDAIRWDTTSGTVENIGLKTTRVRALTGEEVVMANAILLDKELHNMARLDRRRIVQQFGVTYQTPPETCANIPSLVREIVESSPKCTLVRCGMIGFAASSLDFEVQFDVHSENYDEVFAARSQVLIAILKRFNDDGIDFAYPTQTSFTAAPDGTLVMPYADVTMVATEDLKG